MDKIKTPVRYDDGSDFLGNPCIRDADGRHICEISAWQFNWPLQGGKDTDEITPENGHAVGNQIANALNTAADQSRVIEGLIEGLKHYADESFWDDPHPDLRYGEGTQYNFEDEIAGQMPGYQVAQAVIAEAQRILEGK